MNVELEQVVIRRSPRRSFVYWYHPVEQAFYKTTWYGRKKRRRRDKQVEWHGV